MTGRLTTAACVAMGMFCVHAVQADFVAPSVELVADDGPGGLATWRVYLHFTEETDQLLSVGAIPGVGALQIWSESGFWIKGVALWVPGRSADGFVASQFLAGPLESIACTRWGPCS